MSGIPRLASTPEWKQYLRLGEKLLSQPNAAAQCTLIVENVQQVLGAAAKLWLAEPFFPLPGEPELDTLPSESAPALVTSALSCRCGMVQLEDHSLAKLDNPEERQVRQLALPLFTHDNLLGILAVERPGGPSLRPEECNYLEGLAAHAALALQISRQVVLKNWRSDQLALVREVSAQIANMVDLDDLSRHVTELIQSKFHYYYVAIFTLEPREQHLHFRASASSNPQASNRSDFIVTLGEGLVGQVAASGQEIISEDVRQEPRFRFMDIVPNTRSEISLPLKIGQTVLGVLDVQSDELAAFHENDVIVLRALADNIALAVEGARLYTHLQRRAEQLSAVFEVTRALTSILDLSELADEVVSTIQKRFGYPYVHMFTVHPGRRKVFYIAGSGARSKAMANQSIAYDLDAPKGVISWVARHGETVLVNDINQDERYLPTALPPTETQAELTVPLQFGDEVLGVLDIQSDQANVFDENDVFLFEALAGSVAVAMHNASMYRSEQWRRQVADSFRDVAWLVSKNTAIDELLETILDQLLRNLPCEAAAIWLTDENAREDEIPTLRLAASRGVSTEKLTASLEKPGIQERLHQALLDDEPIIRQPGDPYGPLGVAMECSEEYSSIAAPLRAGEKSLGVLTLAHQTARRYGSEARAMVSTFASYAAVAIQNTRLYKSAQEQAYISTVLLQVAEASQAANTTEELLETMSRLTPLLIGVQKCAFFLWDEFQSAFLLSAWYGFDIVEDRRLFPASEALAFTRLKDTQQAALVFDAELELNLPEASAPDHGHLVLLPLVSRGQLLGAFLVAHKANSANSSQAYNNQNLAILQGIAHQTAISVENINLLEARQEEAYVTAVLLQVAQAVVSQNELADVLDTIVHLMQILVGIDTSAIYLWDRDQQMFILAQSNHGLGDEDVPLVRMYVPGEFPLLDEVFARDEMVVCPLANPDISPDRWPDLECLPPVENIMVASSWMLGFPLSVKGEVYGVMVAKEVNVRPSIRDRRMEIIHGIAQQVSLAIQNERLNDEMVERERLEKEMELARQIQKTFLPNRLPQPKNWEIEVQWQTARQVGGDFYDIFRLGKGRLGLVIADVADKGLPAALYMTVTRTLIRAISQNNDSPGRVLERVNKLLVMDSPSSMFVTAVFAVLDTETGSFTYANAGHNRPLILRASSGEIDQLPLGNMALGILTESRIADREFHLLPGDSLVLFTDGVTETFSAGGEQFGDERLSATIQKVAAQSDLRLLEGIERELRQFRQGEPPSDDMTLVVVKRKPVPASNQEE